MAEKRGNKSRAHPTRKSKFKDEVPEVSVERDAQTIREQFRQAGAALTPVEYMHVRAALGRSAMC